MDVADILCSIILYVSELALMKKNQYKVLENSGTELPRTDYAYMARKNPRVGAPFHTLLGADL